MARRDRFASLAVTALIVAGVSLSAAGKAKFGHKAYAVAPESDLREAGRYREGGRVVQLRAEAADAFRAMVGAAAAEGVHIVPISGFRTLAYQNGLFERGKKKHGSAKKAAKWVAPPGYSEHHTGWTLDLGDKDKPDTDVEQSFENTEASRWLRANAARFHFELSFPKDNPQGVSYEPWHWRYVGNEEARKTFHPERD